MWLYYLWNINQYVLYHIYTQHIHILLYCNAKLITHCNCIFATPNLTGDFKWSLWIGGRYRQVVVKTGLTVFPPNLVSANYDLLHIETDDPLALKAPSRIRLSLKTLNKAGTNLVRLKIPKPFQIKKTFFFFYIFFLLIETRKERQSLWWYLIITMIRMMGLTKMIVLTFEIKFLIINVKIQDFIVHNIIQKFVFHWYSM